MYTIMEIINYLFGGISMKQKIAVLGPGSWGTALAQTLAENGHDVRIWGNVPEQIDEINKYHTNQHFLPDLTIPESIIGYKELAEAVDNADAILFVVPTKAIRSVAQELIGKMNTKPIIIHASKGLEQDTHKRISEVLAEEIPEEKDRQLLYYLVLAMLRKWQYMISQQLQLQVLIKKQQPMYKNCS